MQNALLRYELHGRGLGQRKLKLHSPILFFKCVAQSHFFEVTLKVSRKLEVFVNNFCYLHSEWSLCKVSEEKK